MYRTRNIIALFVIFLATAAGAQTIPPLINYQGRLMDSGGMPITGSVPATFALWDGATGGAELWTESKAVEVSGGLYSVMLGDSVAIPASVFSGSIVYLEVTVMGETLAPREHMTAVPYAFHAGDADSLGGIPASGYAQVGNIDFSQLTGTATDAQIPNNITINLAQNATDLGGQPAAAYVLVAGDTVTGDLQVNGTLHGNPDLTVANNLSVTGGSIGLGTAPNPNYGIFNSESPLYGAYLYGTDGGVYGNNTSDTANSGTLGSSNSGVTGYGGNSLSLAARFGGYFEGESQSNAYGIYTLAFGDGTGPAYGMAGYAQSSGAANSYGGSFATGSGGTGNNFGVYATGSGSASAATYGIYASGSNSSTGDSYGGYFQNSNAGTGVHYGLYAASDTYPGYFAWSTDPLNHYAFLGGQYYGINTNAGTSSETGNRFGGYFTSSTQGSSFGVLGVGYGYGTGDAYGIYGLGDDYSSGVTYGSYFYAAPDGTGVHYGSRAESYGQTASATYGVSGLANNSSTGPAYGGSFTATSSGTGDHYGIRGEADGAAKNTIYGVVGVADGSSGNGYGGYFTASDSSAGGVTFGVYGSGGLGVVGAWTGDTTHTYAELGTFGKAVYATAGTSGSSYDQTAGYFTSYSSTYSNGVTTYGQGYGSYDAYGITAVGDNYGSGDSYGALLGAYAASGTAYGLYVASGTKNWVNPDPENPDQAIVYSTVESGENVTYFAGTARLVNGRAVVKLPDHFRKVTSPDRPIVVQLTPRSTMTYGLAVTESDNDHIVVEELIGGKGNFQFDYTVKGIRLGYEDFQPIIANKDYVPFQGHLSSMDASKMTTQEFYNQQSPGLRRIFERNGTLDNNGKVNEAVFKTRGWKDVKGRRPAK